MSTRGMIGLREQDGSILAIPCQHDCYPTGAGMVLYLYYTDETRVRKLLALGEIANVRPRMEKSEPIPPNGNDGVVFAYHRDGDSPYFSPEKYKDRKDFLNPKTNHGADYCYLFEDDIWYVGDVHSKKWKSLKDALKGDL